MTEPTDDNSTAPEPTEPTGPTEPPPADASVPAAEGVTPPADVPPPVARPVDEAPPAYGSVPPPDAPPPAYGSAPPAYGSMPPAAPPYGEVAAGYGAPVPAGMYIDPTNGLVLPNGVVLAPVGRRIGAFFLAIPLSIVTLGIGYLIWGAIVWGKGTSPALQVLGMRAWAPENSAPASWGRMALRNIVGGIVQGFLWLITLAVSFILFLTGKEHKSIPDHIGGTVIVHDPDKILA